MGAVYFGQGIPHSGTNPNGLIVGSFDYAGSVLMGFAFTHKRELCTDCCLLISLVFAPDDKLGKVWLAIQLHF